MIHIHISSCMYVYMYVHAKSKQKKHTYTSIERALISLNDETLSSDFLAVFSSSFLFFLHCQD